MNNINTKKTIFYLWLLPLLDYAALGVVTTIFPELLLDVDYSILNITYTEDTRIIILGFVLGIYALGQSVGATFFGKLSDKFGRKNILLITLTGTFLGFSLLSLAIIMQSILLLFFSRLLTGLYAGNVTIAQASMVDISDHNNRARNINLIQIASGIAWTVGPFSAGWFSEFTSTSWIKYSIYFVILATLFMLATLIILFFYNETLSYSNRQKSIFSKNLQKIDYYIGPKVIFALMVWGVFAFGWWLFVAFLPTYLLHNIGFTLAETGYFLALMGASYTISQIVIMRNMKKLSSQNILKVSLLTAGLIVAGLVLVENVFLLCILIIIYIVSMAFSIPGLITRISFMVNENIRGKVTGLIFSIQALAMMGAMFSGGFLISCNNNITVVAGGALILLSWLLYLYI